MVNKAIKKIKVKIYDEGLVDPEEFFIKTKDTTLNLERLMHDNRRVKKLQCLTGQAFRSLLDGIKEEVESEDEYIFITKNKEGYLIRHEVRDDFEDIDICNEWFLTC